MLISSVHRPKRPLRKGELLWDNALSYISCRYAPVTKCITAFTQRILPLRYSEGQLIHTVSNNESVRLADGIKLNKIFEIQIGSLKIDFNGYALKTAGVSPEAPSLVKSVNVFGVKEMQRLWSLAHGSIQRYHPFSKHQLCNYKRNFSWRIHCPFSHKLEQSIS